MILYVYDYCDCDLYISYILKYFTRGGFVTLGKWSDII